MAKNSSVKITTLILGFLILQCSWQQESSKPRNQHPFRKQALTDPLRGIVFQVTGNNKISTPIKGIPKILNEPPSGIPSDFLQQLEKVIQKDGVSMASASASSLSGIPIEFGMVASVELCVDFEKGSIDLTGWLWGGLGYHKGDSFYGLSMYQKWPKDNAYHIWTDSRLKWGKYGTCAPECQVEWYKDFSLAGVAFFSPAKKFSFDIINGLSVGFVCGLSSKCKGSLEGIVFIDLLRRLPVGATLNQLANKVGAKVQAGIQGNVSYDICPSSEGEIVNAGSSGCFGGFIEIGWIPNS